MGLVETSQLPLRADILGTFTNSVILASADCSSFDLQIIITLFPLLAPETPKLPPLPPTSLTPLLPLTPALVLCALFFSSTGFTESISLSKYPEAYGAYRQRVAMFVPLLTPFWGLLLKVRGKKEVTDEMLFGQERNEGDKDE